MLAEVVTIIKFVSQSKDNTIQTKQKEKVMQKYKTGLLKLEQRLNDVFETKWVYRSNRNCKIDYIIFEDDWDEQHEQVWKEMQ